MEIIRSKILNLSCCFSFIIFSACVTQQTSKGSVSDSPKKVQSAKDSISDSTKKDQSAKDSISDSSKKDQSVKSLVSSPSSPKIEEPTNNIITQVKELYNTYEKDKILNKVQELETKDKHSSADYKLALGILYQALGVLDTQNEGKKSSLLKSHEYLNLYLKEKPDDITGKIWLTQTLFFLGDLSTLDGFKYGLPAKKELDKLVNEAPDNKEVKIMLGDYCLYAPSLWGGNLEKAIQIFSDLYKQYPEDALVVYELAECYRLKDQPEKAEPLYNLAVKLAPKNPRVRR